jgi:hypothetical protein
MMKALISSSAAVAVLSFAQAAPQVPAALETLVGRHVIEFATYLADAHVACGLELREGDDVPFDTSHMSVDATPTVSREEVFGLFNSRQKDYKASVLNDVVTLRPVVGRAAVLDEVFDFGPQSIAKGAVRAENRVMEVLDPLLAGTLVGSSIGTVDRGDALSITLSGGRRTLADALNEVVRQFPRCWYVTTRPLDNSTATRITAFGFIFEQASRSRRRIQQP